MSDAGVIIVTYFLIIFDLVIERYQQNVDEIPKGRRAAPEIKDFKRLNKVVLKEGATNAAVSHLLLPIPVNHSFLATVKQELESESQPKGCSENWSEKTAAKQFLEPFLFYR